jgi:protein-disulfide isomerase
MALGGIIVGYLIANSLHGPSLIPSGGTQIPNGGAAASSAPTVTNDPADADDDPFIGEEDAPVTIIEFTDFQCPFCSRHFEQTFGQIKKDYVDTGKVKYVSRDYPLSFHPNADEAAEAANCANDQDKYWEMHDKLFSNQGTWSNLSDAVPTFKQYATDIGLNASEFASCIDANTHADEIAADLADGSASGISGTPGFWLIGPDGEGQLISGAYPYDTFKAAIDSYLQ